LFMERITILLFDNININVNKNIVEVLRKQ
jgi:hypothetical protein